MEAPLVTLESDKATMEVPSTVAGVVVEVLLAVGDRVSSGAKVVTVEADAAQAAPAAAPPAETAPAAAAPEVAPPDAPLPEAGPSEPTPAPVASSAPTDAAPTYASPTVRRLARELGVDLAGVAGTGRKGRIVRADVEAAAARPVAPAAPTATGSATAGTLAIADWPRVDFAKFGPVEREPLARLKRIAGPYLQRNWVVIPHVTQFDEADITDLEAFRKATNEELAQGGVKLTMVALVMKACVASLHAFPHVNASLDGDELVIKRYYNIGFAADTPFGLVVPVIRDVDRKGIREIAAELGELSKIARDGKLTPEQMSGGTFTISSLGGIGGTAFTPIVNAPEVAILGVSRSAIKPVWDGTAFQPRLMLPLSLSYDHRVIDGAEAARFTTHLAAVLSDLRRALL